MNHRATRRNSTPLTVSEMKSLASRKQLRFILAALAMVILGSCSKGWDLAVAEDSVVRVLKVDPRGRLFKGSGFLISEQGHIATNSHVVNGSIRLFVVRKNGNNVEVYSAKIIADDEDLDMAVIQGNGLKGDPVKLCSAKPKKTAKVYAVGFPGQSDDTGDLNQLIERIDPNNLPESFPLDESIRDAVDPPFKTGTVEAVRRMSWASAHTNEDMGGKDLDIIHHNATITWGNSGGPLFDSSTQVIGINSGGHFDTQMTEDGETLQANNLKFAGRITEIFQMCQRNNVPYKTSRWAPRLDGGDSANKQLALIVLVTALALIVILVLFGRQPVVKERLSQLVRPGRTRVRSGSVNKPVIGPGGEVIMPGGPKGGGGRTKIDGNRGEDRTRYPDEPRYHGRDARRTAAALAEERWVLEGNGPDGRLHRVEIEGAMLSRSRDGLRVGRTRDKADLEVDDRTVSRPHARIYHRKSSLYLEDLGSANGTFVNGERIGGRVQAIKLKEGSEVKLGEVRLRFRASRR